MDYSSCENKSFTPGQIYKMYDFYKEYRALTKPCQPSQIKLQLEIQFDSEPSKVQLSYITWGENKYFNFYPMAAKYDSMNLKNKLVVGKICINRYSTHQVLLSQNGSVAFNERGYFSISADGNDLARGNVSEKSYVISVDTICKTNSSHGKNSGRFRLELKFDEYPEDQEWYILDSQNNSVADHTLTTGYGFTNYIGNFGLSVIIFEKCLWNGVYRFQLMDNYEDGISAPGYYKIFLDGNHVAGSNNLLFPDSYILAEVTFAVGFSLEPTVAPTKVASIAPMSNHSKIPTILSPTNSPGASPSKAPHYSFSPRPYFVPTKTPKERPSAVNDLTQAPKHATNSPTKAHLVVPTRTPTLARDKVPSRVPKKSSIQPPTLLPTRVPSKTSSPTSAPTTPKNATIESKAPTTAATKTPPARTPTKNPARTPTIVRRTMAPTKNSVVTRAPTKHPTTVSTKTPNVATPNPTMLKTTAPKPTTTSKMGFGFLNYYFELFI
jgi:hypothetical protein